MELGYGGVGNKILKVSVCGCLQKVCQVKTCTSIQWEVKKLARQTFISLPQTQVKVHLLWDCTLTVLIIILLNNIYLKATGCLSKANYAGIYGKYACIHRRMTEQARGLKESNSHYSSAKH